MKKSLILLLVATLILSMLAGCSGSTETAEESPQQANEASQPVEPPVNFETPVVSDQPAAGDEILPEETTETLSYSIEYPIETDVTLTCWMPFKAPHESIGEYNDFPLLGDYAKITGVTVDFKSVSQMAATEQFNLMVASGEYSDMTSGAVSTYTGTLEAAIEDGLCIELGPYLEQYMPDYCAMLNSDETALKTSMDDSGRIVAVYTLKDCYWPVMSQLCIRQDWLDDLGMEVPQTIEEAESFLLAVKAAYDPYNCFEITSSNYIGAFTEGMGIGAFTEGAGIGNGIYQVDGEIRYTAVQPEYKEYIETMARWYENGLFTQDFLSLGTTGNPGELAAYIYTDDVAIFSTTASEFENHKANAQNPNFEVEGIGPITKTTGDTTHFTDISSIKTSESISISENCKNVELACMWLNFWFTNYGSDLANYGIEGMTFDYDNDGTPYFTEFVTNNDLDIATNRFSAIYSLYAKGVPIATQEKRLQQTFTDKMSRAYEVWTARVDGEYLLPAITLSAVESESTSSFLTDIETLIEENVAKFIIGEKDMAEWDNFISEVYAMRLDDIMAVYQAALDRYNLRGA